MAQCSRWSSRSTPCLLLEFLHPPRAPLRALHPVALAQGLCHDLRRREGVVQVTRPTVRARARLHRTCARLRRTCVRQGGAGHRCAADPLRRAEGALVARPLRMVLGRVEGEGVALEEEEAALEEATVAVGGSVALRLAATALALHTAAVARCADPAQTTCAVGGVAAGLPVAGAASQTAGVGAGA